MEEDEATKQGTSKAEDHSGTEDGASSSGGDAGPSGSQGPGNDNAKELKLKRGAQKGLLTRILSDLEMSLADEELPEVERLLATAKEKFRDFQSIHDEYYETLTQPEEKIKNEKYYLDKQQEYIQCVKTARAWLKSVKGVDSKTSVMPAVKNPLLKPAPQSPSSSRISSQIKQDSSELNQGAALFSDGPVTRRDILSIANMPKVELEQFDGDPMRFHEFFASFDENVHNVTTDGAMRLSRLQQYCIGDAKKAIRSCTLLGGEAGYQQARRILSSRFGDNHIVAQGVIKGLKSSKLVKSSTELRHFADELSTGHATLESMGKLPQIDTQWNILEIAECLPTYVKNRWKRIAMDFKSDKGDYPRFTDFVQFVAKQAEEATDPVYGTWNVSVSAPKSTSMDKKPKSFATGAKPNKVSCVLCREEHRLFWCPKFKAMKPVDRLKFVNDKKLCHNCLMSNHLVDSCRKPSVCSVPGCGQKHTKFIHIDNNSTASSTPLARVHRAEVDTVDMSGMHLCLPLVNVIVDNKCSVLAMLDTGSTTTFCTQKLVNELGKRGVKTTYSLTTLSNCSDVRETELVNLDLMSCDGHNMLKLRNVYVVESIPVASASVDISMHSHLQGLSVVVGGDVDLLIGQDNSEALLPLEVRRGRAGDPFAVRTCLGWSVNVHYDPVRIQANMLCLIL